MLYRHREIFRSLMMLADLVLISLIWLGAYAVRFHFGVPAPRGVPPVEDYLVSLGAILPVFAYLLSRQGLYEPRRLGSVLTEAAEMVRVVAIGVVVLMAIAAFIRSYSFSRGVVITFSALAPICLVGLRVFVRTALRAARRRGYNRRFALVVGQGRLAQEVIQRIQNHPDSGLHLIGVLGEGGGEQRVGGVPVIGGYGELKTSLGKQRIDHVIIALPSHESYRLEKILDDLDDELVSVILAPDLLQIATLHSSIETLDGLPLIHFRDSPLIGWAAVQKRVFDLVGGGLLLFLFLPILGLLSLGLLLTSGRPIFYAQDRMGLDGRVFRMLKLRTMTTDAESQGPGWSIPDDPRRTRYGGLLRRFSLDELPWHVVRGEMSLVGPRPERPNFIEEFRREIPGYMLRHKVKSGVTGWAQVHGWRGDSSLRERIEHDLYYIQNWSMVMDLKILALTLGSVIRGRNAS